MPPKNGISLSEGVLFADGIELIHVQDIGELDITEGQELTRDDATDFWRGEWCGTVALTPSFLRDMMRIVYGWKAKGPIRKRMLRKLWRERIWKY